MSTYTQSYVVSFAADYIDEGDVANAIEKALTDPSGPLARHRPQNITVHRRLFGDKEPVVYGAMEPAEMGDVISALREYDDRIHEGDIVGRPRLNPSGELTVPVIGNDDRMFETPIEHRYSLRDVNAAMQSAHNSNDVYVWARLGARPVLLAFNSCSCHGCVVTRTYVRK